MIDVDARTFWRLINRMSQHHIIEHDANGSIKFYRESDGEIVGLITQAGTYNIDQSLAMSE